MNSTLQTITIKTLNDHETREAGRKLGSLIRSRKPGSLIPGKCGNTSRNQDINKDPLISDSRQRWSITIALYGGLGAGKTTFVQGFAKGLGVPEQYYVTSPTYTIINEYPADSANENSYQKDAENGKNCPADAANANSYPAHTANGNNCLADTANRNECQKDAGTASPFYSLMLYHMDLYRLGSPEELEYIGFDDITASDNSVIIIEWPDIIDESIIKFDIKIHITTDQDFNRKISFIPSGLEGLNLLNQLAV
ncbi:MAG: tRNA (adenosine(37)-N6)-threonylcarbamoyltransferase complex ATPase subunit type 1 TsaE [Desulfamplus sp.]|nr:tRNA (adenosine(37)-N6)-threonylcarbamoyltransferase complex ATPase subunit type 1 TsaE [Desulfamplus sp.]